MFFLFSSRRRHTRCSRDWSSDVCSSDLAPSGPQSKREAAAGRLAIEGVSVIVELFEPHARGVERADGFLLQEIEQARACMSRRPIRSSVADYPEIGRAHV